MLDHGREALNLIGDYDRERFEHDRVMQLAVVRLLEIIGEAATRTPEAIRDEHPSAPWRQISGMRNRLIHGYDAVDLEIVWIVLTGDLPDLVAKLDAIVSPHGA
jgi:uncharacterized protein with HEPN domain